jgi:hypothetical protein
VGPVWSILYVIVPFATAHILLVPYVFSRKPGSENAPAAL